MVRRNCSFCNHPDREDMEQQIRIGTMDVKSLDRDQGWPEGTAHRHMRRHSGSAYHNNSNSDCPLCTDPDRSSIEEAILNGIASIDDFAAELELPSSLISQHMEKHTKPVIQRQASIEVLPAAIRSAHDSLVRIENNMNRLDSLLSNVLDRLEKDMADDDNNFMPMKEIDTAIRVHREVRETLSELAKWMEKADSVDKQQSVSVLTVIQAHFSEKSPEEWRLLRSALAEAGVLEDG
jgi:hypothetical protein